MLGYNRTITITKNNVSLNIGPGAGEGREKKEVKKNSLPNNFDDNCSPEFVLLIVFLLKGIERNFKSCCGGQKKEKKNGKRKKSSGKTSIACREPFFSQPCVSS